MVTSKKATLLRPCLGDSPCCGHAEKEVKAWFPRPILGSRSSADDSPQLLPDPSQRIIKLIDHSLLERNDPVVRDLNFLRTNLGAALGDVAVADAVGVSQLLDPI